MHKYKRQKTPTNGKMDDWMHFEIRTTLRLNCRAQRLRQCSRRRRLSSTVCRLHNFQFCKFHQTDRRRSRAEERCISVINFISISNSTLCMSDIGIDRNRRFHFPFAFAGNENSFIVRPTTKNKNEKIMIKNIFHGKKIEMKIISVNIISCVEWIMERRSVDGKWLHLHVECDAIIVECVRTTFWKWERFSF